MQHASTHIVNQFLTFKKSIALTPLIENPLCASLELGVTVASLVEFVPVCIIAALLKEVFIVDQWAGAVFCFIFSAHM